MASQAIIVTALSGQSLYVVIVNSTDQTFWNTVTPAFENFNAAHWANYVISLNEIGQTGIYSATYPAGIVAGTLTTEIFYRQSAGSPSIANDSPPVQSGSTQGTVTLANLDKVGYSLASGQIEIKKNQALPAFEFLMVDSSDHVSPKTGLTVTATRSIDGGAFGASSNSPSEIGSGIYALNLAASDLNGRIITFKFSSVGADTRFITMVTQD